MTLSLNFSHDNSLFAKNGILLPSLRYFSSIFFIFLWILSDTSVILAASLESSITIFNNLSSSITLFLFIFSPIKCIFSFISFSTFIFLSTAIFSSAFFSFLLLLKTYLILFNLQNIFPSPLLL